MGNLILGIVIGILVWPALTALVFWLLRPRETKGVQEARKIIEEAHL